jgi:hypothetical protein
MGQAMNFAPAESRYHSAGGWVMKIDQWSKQDDQETGANWCALETSTRALPVAQADPQAFPGTFLAPDTDSAAGLKSVRMWLRGVKFTAKLKGSNGNDSDLNLSGPITGYRFGLIQLVRTQPIMTSEFEGNKTRKWKQQHVPVLDTRSDHADAAPFYCSADQQNQAAWLPIDGSEQSVVLADYPTAKTNLLYDPALANSGRLIALRKKLVFDVYLAVAKKDVAYENLGDDDLRILVAYKWNSETHLTFTWNANGTFKYHVEKASGPNVSVGIAKADLMQSRMCWAQFPETKDSANDTIVVC